MFKTQLHSDRLEILIDAPASANALSLDGARELAKLTRRHARIEVPVVVRSTKSDVFCSGGNLRDHQALRTRGAGLRVNAEIARHLDAFGEWRTPKIAIVEGAVIGGGVEWLARFDARWMTPVATLTFAQKRVGLSFGWGGGAAWARWIGEARVRQLLLEARPLAADEALRLGLADRVIDSADLGDQLSFWCRNVAGPVNADLARWTTRRERLIFKRLWWGQAHLARLRAFGHKS